MGVLIATHARGCIARPSHPFNAWTETLRVSIDQAHIACAYAREASAAGCSASRMHGDLPEAVALFALWSYDYGHA